MALKVFLLGLCVSAVTSIIVAEGQDADSFDPHPNYNFKYEVQDSSSGDFKSVQEDRDGDLVHGEYSLHDADGYRRVVKYSVDSKSGFRAQVQRTPLVKRVVKANSKLLPSVKPAKIQNPPVYKPNAVRPYIVPTLIHYSPAHTLIHHTPSVQFHESPDRTSSTRTFVHTVPAVHLAPTTHHIVHSGQRTILLKDGQTGVMHHHHHHLPAAYTM